MRAQRAHDACPCRTLFVQVGLVSAYLFSRYSPAFGLITVTVMTTYVASTIFVTEVRAHTVRAHLHRALD